MTHQTDGIVTPASYVFDGVNRETTHVQLGDDTTSPEQRIWIATINNALLEALGHDITKGACGSKRHAQDMAIKWFTEGKRDFQEVCLWAGLDPDYVQEKALAVIKNPKPFARVRRRSGYKKPQVSSRKQSARRAYREATERQARIKRAREAEAGDTGL